MEEKPDYLGHRERLRKRFQKSGEEGLHDYELLELLLTYAIPRRDVKPYAKNLIKKFGSLAGVLDASPKELEEVLHVGPISSTLIHLVKKTLRSVLGGKDDHPGGALLPPGGPGFRPGKNGRPAPRGLHGHLFEHEKQGPGL